MVKACISGVIAFAILTGVCMLYYNKPLDCESVDGATDYSWEKNKFYSIGTEGFAWGKTNNEGYLNPEDYTESTQVDILIMGSSHMEAYQVTQDQSAAGVLRTLMPEKNIYNIGISGHTFLICADNLFEAVNKYEPTEYVVMETYSIGYTDIQLQEAINENVTDLISVDRGFIKIFQKNPFLRLIYSQLKSFSDNAVNDSESPAFAEIEIASNESYCALLAKLNAIVSDKGAQLIIVYHPFLSLNKDGTASLDSDNELSKFFEECCEKNGIIFLDMSEPFLEGYENEFVLPYGFTNTSVGSGHLNKNGHAMIAKSLYEIMKEAD